jgi:hypothetical protein
MRKIYIITILIVILIFFIQVRQKIVKNRILSKLSFETYEQDPRDLHNTEKIIWSFWDKNEKPLSVKLAIHSWKKNNPDCVIVMLNENNIGNYVDTSTFPKKYSTCKPQHKADIIRLAVLEEYGGYWLDATLYTNTSLTKLWDLNYDVGGYYAEWFTSNKENPVFENWFISAPKNSPLVADWKREYYRGLSFANPKDYISEIEKTVDLQKIDDKTYLMMHCSFLKITSEKQYNIKSISAGTNGGPLEYLVLPAFGPITSLYLITIYDRNIPILKITGRERRFVEKLWWLSTKNNVFEKML